MSYQRGIRRVVFDANTIVACQPHEGKDSKGAKFTDLYCMPAGTLNQRSKVDDPSTGGTTSGDMSSGNPPSGEKPPGGSSGNKEDRPYVE